ncbi:conjugal transfer protein [Salmonella enterica subsp. enterica serovar Enteritidis str. 648903 1-6]|nr:conjugal transfer protein [Salmonella enterica subsp. enterica serovar Enteritidis str. 648903 1-6]
MNVVSEFITTINTVVQSGAASNAAKIAKAISPVFVAAVLLYIVYVAYEITYSQRDIILSEVTKLIASLSLVGAFTYTAPYYSQYVIPFVMHAGSDLSNALTGTGDVATSVDGLWEKLSTIMDNFISSKVQELSMTDIGGVYRRICNMGNRICRRCNINFIYNYFFMYINFHGWFTACDWHYIYMLFFFPNNQKHVHFMVW